MRRVLGFSDIKAYCRQYDIGLHSAIAVAGNKNRSSLKLSAEPYDTFAAANEAGAILREQPGAHLARQPFPEAFVNGIPPQDIAASSLVRIVNSSITREAGASPDTTFTCQPSNIYDVCGEAETGFAATFVHMQAEEPTDIPPTLRYQIVSGRNDRPLLLRKGIGLQSALSLLPLTINGITYPGGSLMRYDLSRDAKGNTSKPRYASYPLASPKKEVVSVNDVAHISFLRISAYALQSGNQRRTVFHKNLFGTEPQGPGYRALWDLELEDISKIAGHAVSQLRSAAPPKEYIR